jgi:Protein of unknown function (DUF1254)
MGADQSTATDTDLKALTAEAFVYGFPLVFNLGQVDRFVREGLGVMPAAVWNRWAHTRALAGPQDTFVSINNDTVYTVAALDLSGGPLRLEVPDAADRYYVLQFVDAWTNNFAYVGRRATSATPRSVWRRTLRPTRRSPTSGAPRCARAFRPAASGSSRSSRRATRPSRTGGSSTISDSDATGEGA